MSWKYEDIVDLPRPAPRGRAPMSRLDRAAQFSPFAALTGYEETIEETARLTEACRELTEEETGRLNEKLRILSEWAAQQPEVSIRYFRWDPLKAGGAYVTVSGRVRRVDAYTRQVELTDGTCIPMEAISALEGTVLHREGPDFA